MDCVLRKILGGVPRPLKKLSRETQIPLDKLFILCILFIYR